MNQVYQRLRADLPPRQASDSSAFPSDPRRIKAWVDALPRANQQATLRQLSEALQALKGLRLEGAQRLLAMEALRASLLDGVALLDKQLQGTAFPLLPAKAQVADQLQAFQRELALAYRLAVVELCGPNGSVPFLKGAQVSLALERALYHASRDLALAYFLYRSPAAGVWSSLNSLYAFALQLKLDDKAVDEPVERLALGPRQIYAQALLLALSNPYRFSGREQAELWPITRDLAAHLELSMRRPGDDAFAIAITEDHGPGYLPEERATAAGEILWMNLAGLRAALEGPLSGEGGGPVQVRFRQGTSVLASADLLRRLRAGWGQAAARGHQRLSAGHVLSTVIGLSGLHYCLAGHRHFDAFLRLAQGEGDHSDWAQGGIESGRVPVVPARVLDQSLGGYRLCWAHEEGLRARVGELVGVTLAGDAGRRAVDDQHRHRRRGMPRTTKAGRRTVARRLANWCASRSTPQESAAGGAALIRDKLADAGSPVPLIGDFHYNGHSPAAATGLRRGLAKYRINPGNVGFGKKRDTQFATS
jgi:hypothetical protein